MPVTDSEQLNQTDASKPHIAVIGAGLAGLSAAWLLRDKYQVTLYERHERAGMGVFTNDYHSNGISTRIDIPLRIFTQGYYPQLFALYKHLEIEMEDSDHASVYQSLNSNGELTPFFQYGNFSLFKKTFSYLYRNSINMKGLKLVWAQYQFFKQAHKDMGSEEPLKHKLAKITFAQYVAENDFSDDFIRQLLLPALSVTCTCDYDGILNYPADLILGYLTCGVMDAGIVRAKLGVDGIVPKITQGYQVHCHHQVEKLVEETSSDSVLLQVKNLTSGETFENKFDRVIVATQADIAAQILELVGETPLENNQSQMQQKQTSLQARQSALLKRIPLQSSTMVLHTDTELVYSQSKASPVSYIVDKNMQRPSTSVDLTKAFSTYADQAPVFQTWNILKAPKPEQVISSQDFTRPLVTLDSRKAIAKLKTLNNSARIQICGSYMANKIPLLDAAVESSVALAKQLGCHIPWENNHGLLSNEIPVSDTSADSKSVKSQTQAECV